MFILSYLKEKVFQKIIHLPIPPGPVMIDIMAPVINPGRDGFFREQIIQATGIFNGFYHSQPLIINMVLELHRVVGDVNGTLKSYLDSIEKV